MNDRAAAADGPLVSVVIPCWNGARFIAAAIESVLAQTYSHVELIVIDDGSVDDSLAIIKSYGERVRYETGPNCGGSAARNRGLALARGQIVQFLDADDLLFPHRLEYMTRALRDADPATLVVSDWIQVDETGQTKRMSVAPPKSDAFVWLLSNGIPIMSPLHRRSSLLRIGGFDERLPCCQEYELHLRLAAHGVVLHHVPEPLFQVRRRLGSVSSDSIEVYSQHLSILRELSKTIGFGDRERNSWRRAIARKLSHDGRLLVRFGAKKTAREFFAEARRIDKAGYASAFGHPATKAVRIMAGAVMAERVASAVASVRGRRKRPLY